MNRLQQPHDPGVSIWLDTLQRELLETGAFAELGRDYAVTGATSNPDDLRQGDHELGPLRRAAASRSRCSSSSKSAGAGLAGSVTLRPEASRSRGRRQPPAIMSFQARPGPADGRFGT